MPAIVSFYEILGVSRDSSPAAIRAAYLSAMKRWHPDVAGDGPRAADRSRRTAEAYACLRDPARRAAHDALLNANAPLRLEARVGTVARRLTHRRPTARPQSRYDLRRRDRAVATVVVAAMALVVVAAAQRTAPSPFQATAATFADPGDGADEEAQDGVDPAIIQEAALDSRWLRLKSGVSGTEAFSSRCFAELTGDGSLMLLDYCTAFDAAAAGQSASAPYFAPQQRRIRFEAARRTVDHAGPERWDRITARVARFQTGAIEQPYREPYLPSAASRARSVSDAALTSPAR